MTGKVVDTKQRANLKSRIESERVKDWPVKGEGSLNGAGGQKWQTAQMGGEEGED